MEASATFCVGFEINIQISFTEFLAAMQAEFSADGDDRIRTCGRKSGSRLATECNNPSLPRLQYPRSDSNRDCSVPKTDASFHLGYAGELAEAVGLDPTSHLRCDRFSGPGRCNYALRLQVQKDGFEPPMSRFGISLYRRAPSTSRPLLQYPEKGSNLQPSRFERGVSASWTIGAKKLCWS